MTSFRRFSSINGKKTFLLKEFNYKSIKTAKKENGFNGTDAEMYKILLDEHNHVVENLKEEQKKQITQSKKESLI